MYVSAVVRDGSIDFALLPECSPKYLHFLKIEVICMCLQSQTLIWLTVYQCFACLVSRLSVWLYRVSHERSYRKSSTYRENENTNIKIDLY